MRQIGFAGALVMALAIPATAQENDDTSNDLSEGLDLLGRGAELMLQGVFAELGPAWAELQTLLNNLNAYYPPEILPNGDILIRRKPKDAPPAPEDEATEL